MVVYNRRQQVRCQRGRAAPLSVLDKQAPLRLCLTQEMDDGAIIQANLDVGWYTAEEEPEMREAAVAPFMRQRKDKRHTH